MSKYCGNCGSQLDDDALVCGYCGATLENSPNSAIPSFRISGINEMDEMKKAKIKNYSIKCGISIAVLLVIIIAINIIISSTGINGAVKKMINAFEDCDTTKLASMTSSLAYYDADVDEIEKNIEKNVEYTYEDYEDRAGDKLKFDYEIVKKEKISDRKRDRVLEYYENRYDDFDASAIGDIYNVNVKITAKGSKRKLQSKTIRNIYFIKENGEWKILYGTLD